jgi:hypothetical protein
LTLAIGKSPECAAIIARFGRFVEVHPSGCWLWTGSTTGSWRGGQHGQFSLKHGVNIYAHRFSCLLFHGAIPDGLNICHVCDVGRCVRPDHLFAGTQLDNIRDAKQKGRLSKTRLPRKMSDADVCEALAMRRTGMKLVRIADTFGVSKTFISLLCNGKRRAVLASHVTEDRRSA